MFGNLILEFLPNLVPKEEGGERKKELSHVLVLDVTVLAPFDIDAKVLLFM